MSTHLFSVTDCGWHHVVQRTVADSRVADLSSRVGQLPLDQAGTEGTFRAQEVIIETTKHMTKIETRSILEAMYGIKVEQIHSLNRMGRRKGETSMMPKQTKDFKRFYVTLTNPVELPNVPKALELLKKE